jgi:hypothetical protein
MQKYNATLTKKGIVATRTIKKGAYVIPDGGTGKWRTNPRGNVIKNISGDYIAAVKIKKNSLCILRGTSTPIAFSTLSPFYNNEKVLYSSIKTLTPDDYPPFEPSDEDEDEKPKRPKRPKRPKWPKTPRVREPTRRPPRVEPIDRNRSPPRGRERERQPVKYEYEEPPPIKRDPTITYSDENPPPLERDPTITYSDENPPPLERDPTIIYTDAKTPVDRAPQIKSEPTVSTVLRTARDAALMGVAAYNMYKFGSRGVDFIRGGGGQRLAGTASRVGSSTAGVVSRAGSATARALGSFGRAVSQAIRMSAPSQRTQNPYNNFMQPLDLFNSNTGILDNEDFSGIIQGEDNFSDDAFDEKEPLRVTIHGLEDEEDSGIGLGLKDETEYSGIGLGITDEADQFTRREYNYYNRQEDDELSAEMSDNEESEFDMNDAINSSNDLITQVDDAMNEDAEPTALEQFPSFHSRFKLPEPSPAAVPITPRTVFDKDYWENKRRSEESEKTRRRESQPGLFSPGLSPIYAGRRESQPGLYSPGLSPIYTPKVNIEQEKIPIQAPDKRTANIPIKREVDQLAADPNRRLYFGTSNAQPQRAPNVAQSPPPRPPRLHVDQQIAQSNPYRDRTTPPATRTRARVLYPGVNVPRRRTILDRVLGRNKQKEKRWL